MNWQQLLSSSRSASGTTNTNPDRTEFEKDFDRIIFSLPFRRLQDKTQVFPLPEDDFVHNRLTHSLEVASVGRSLGKLVGEKILSKREELNEFVTAYDFGAIVSAASLAHDVGNPPFGHSGEKAISDFFKNFAMADEIRGHLTESEWEDLINFEGNAQGFRLINQNLHGLKLTYATLGAFTKYPRQSQLASINSHRVSQKKFGYYQSEKNLFRELAKNLGLVEEVDSKAWVRHPLAFLVEAADDICYNIIDLEDGCTLGLVSLEESVDLLKPIIAERFNQEKLDKMISQSEKLATLRALAINELIAQVVDVFVANEEDILIGNYDKSLTSLIRSSDALIKIQRLSVDKIYRAQVVLEKEIAGFEVIDGLLNTLVTMTYNFTFENLAHKDQTIFRALPVHVTSPMVAGKLYSNLRVILDFISGMTDTHALTLYRKLKGMSLPSW